MVLRLDQSKFEKRDNQDIANLNLLEQQFESQSCRSLVLV